MLLSKEQIEHFHTNGFLILDNYFTKTELGDFRESLRRLIQFYLEKASRSHHEIKPNDFVGDELDGGLMKLEEIDHTYVANIYDTIFQTPTFLRIPTKSETTQYINQLFNRNIDSPLYVDTARCRIDVPFDKKRICGWHQEVFYYIPKSDFLQTWAPLISDVTLENGALEVCIGSHKEGFAKQDQMLKEDVHYKYIVNDEIVKKYQPKRLEMKLGQFLIFSSKLIHRSGFNTSKQVRYSLVGIYHNLDNDAFVPPKLVDENRNLSNLSYYDEMFKPNT